MRRRLNQEIGYRIVDRAAGNKTARSAPMVMTSRRLLRQLFTVLLAYHVLGVPVRPVRVTLTGSLFVLPVSGLRTPQRARQITHRREVRRCGVNAPRQPRCDLLEQPPVAVRITKRRERAVATMRGIRTPDPFPPKQVGFVRPIVLAAGTVEHLADFDAAPKQFFAGGLDIGDDQVKTLSGAGGGCGNVLAEDDRASGTRWSELDHAEIRAAVEFAVEAPPEFGVELLRAVNIRDRDDDYRTSSPPSQGLCGWLIHCC
jgi:hypothetical protein